MVVLATEGNQKLSQQGGKDMKGKGVQVFSHDDVHIYFIDPREEGATKRDTTTVRLVMIPLEEQNALSDVVIPPAFLEAGGWIYPLIPSKTPVYRTQEKYYLFPDLLSTSPGASVGIVFAKDMDEDKRGCFEAILLDLAGLKEFPTGFAEKFGNPAELITTNEEAVLDNGSKPLDNELPSKSVVGELGAGLITVAGTATDFITAEAKKTRALGHAESHLTSNWESAKDYAGQAQDQITSNLESAKDYVGQAKSQLNSNWESAKGYVGLAQSQIYSNLESAKEYAGLAQSQVYSNWESAKEYEKIAESQIYSNLESAKGYVGQATSQMSSNGENASGYAGLAQSQIHSNLESAKKYTEVAQSQIASNLESAKGYVRVAQTQVHSNLESAKGYVGQAQTQVRSNLESAKGYVGVAQSQITSNLGNAKEYVGQSQSQLNSNLEGAKNFEKKTESQLNSNFESAKEYAGKAVEISNHAVTKLADATTNLATYSTNYVKSMTSAAMETVQDQTHKGTSALLDGVTAVTDGAMHTMGYVYEALHNAGKALADSITNNHILDHRYDGGKSHIKELCAEATASVNHHYANAVQSVLD